MCLYSNNDEVDNNILLKSLLQLKILYINADTKSSFWYQYQDDFEKIIDIMFLITPSPKKQEFRFFYPAEG